MDTTMENNHLKARPTEYRHVVFRSKSEAIFARGLDIGKFLWQYEPFGDSTFWDFWVVVDGRNPKTKVPIILSAIIEYKPSKPTDTYIHELAESLDDFSGLIRKLLIIGSPFNTEISPEIFILNEDNAQFVSVEKRRWPWVLVENWPRAMEYRFDLEH